MGLEYLRVPVLDLCCYILVSALAFGRKKTPWIDNAQHLDAGQALVTTGGGKQNTWQIERRGYGVTFFLLSETRVQRYIDWWPCTSVRLCV